MSFLEIGINLIAGVFESLCVSYLLTILLCLIDKSGTYSVYKKNSSERFCGWVPALSVKPVDTTGAGDCMVGVFVTRILAGDSLEAAARYACAAASYSTLYTGASTAEISKERMRPWEFDGKK